MAKKIIRKPFFVINPKAYMNGEELIGLAKYADRLAKKYDFDVFFTAQHIDLYRLSRETNNLIITAQHMDSMKPGPGMGHILPKALKDSGVEAVFLNHAEHSIALNKLCEIIEIANELEIITIVCADSLNETKAVSILEPDVIVCEPSSLIGTGKVSDKNYMDSTNLLVKSISKNTKVLQAAGISSGENVLDAILIGADGTGGTSGIVASKDPFATLDEMFEALSKAREIINLKGE